MPISSTTQSERRTTFGDVKEDLSQLKDDASRLADDATKAAKDGAQATWDSARKVADQVQDGHEKVCHYASAHPTAALLIAVGIGAIAGRMLGRWL